MKKKDIDLFGILLGLVIGAVLGYLIFTQVGKDPNDDTDTPAINTNIYGTVYLLQMGKSSNIDELRSIQNQMKVKNLYSEIIGNGDLYYLYGNISDTLEKAQTKKTIYESNGFNPTIKSDYILDFPQTVITSQVEYEFYNDVVLILLKSLEGSTFTIPEKYNITPIDVETFSNITMLSALKNDTIKEQIQLNTYCLLNKKLK